MASKMDQLSSLERIDQLGERIHIYAELTEHYVTRLSEVCQRYQAAVRDNKRLADLLKEEREQHDKNEKSLTEKLSDMAVINKILLKHSEISKMPPSDREKVLQLQAGRIIATANETVFAGNAAVATRRSIDMSLDEECQLDTSRTRSGRVYRHRRSKSNAFDRSVIAPIADEEEDIMPEPSAPTPETIKKKRRRSRSAHEQLRKTPRQETAEAACDSSVLTNQSSLKKSHFFITETAISMHRCFTCDKKLDFGKKALRCHDCNIFVHEKCQSDAPTPCIAHTVRPKAANGKHSLNTGVGKLPPFIPGILILGIKEVERRGMSEQGIYRLSGQARKINEILEEHKKHVVNLRNVDDIHTVAGVVKNYLLQCDDHVIPRKLRWQFLQLAESSFQNGQAIALIEKLPPVNRDTLSCLMRHLQLVAQNSEANSMTFDSLAKIFTPSIFGQGLAPFSDPQAAYQDMAECTVVLSLLLRFIPADFWQYQLDVKDDSMLIERPQWRPMASSVVDDSASSSGVTCTVTNFIKKSIFGSGSRGRNVMSQEGRAVYNDFLSDQQFV